jgi:hypothetical protein
MTPGNRNRPLSRKAGGKIVIVISPAFDDLGKHRPGFFEARVEGDARIVCTSRTPFLDSARQLISEGIDPKNNINMRHVGSPIESFRDPIPMSTAAKLTVKGSKFVLWKPSPGRTRGAATAKSPSRAMEVPETVRARPRGCGTRSSRARKGGA